MQYDAIGGAHGGRSRELRDGNVVGMPVRSIRTESDDHLGPNAPDVRRNSANRRRGGNCVHAAVRVAEDRDLPNPEHRGGFTQLRFTNAADFLRLSALPVWTEPPPLPASSRREIRPDPLSRVFGDRAAETERFIVGMSQNGQQPESSWQHPPSVDHEVDHRYRHPRQRQRCHFAGHQRDRQALKDRIEQHHR